MSDFVILTDSSCDLPATLADSLGLVVAPLTFELEGKQYTNYLDWREIAPHAFYDRLRGTALAPTSAVNVAAFTELMEPILRSGRDILYIGFSSGLSAAYQNGEIAAADLREKYPQRVILTVDSLCASQGEGLLVWLTAHKVRRRVHHRMPGFCRSHQAAHRPLVHRGGPEIPLAGRPGLQDGGHRGHHFGYQAGDACGQCGPSGARLQSPWAEKVLRDLGKNTAQVAINLAEQTIFITHCDCPDEARALGEQIKAAGAKDVIINYVGPVIGSHSGPGTMAIFCVGTER